MAKLYTTYLANMKKVSRDKMIMVFVARFAPKAMNLDNREIVQFTQLSPSPMLLGDWKKGVITWEVFETRFLEEIENRTLALSTIDVIADKIKNRGRDICLVCFEKDNNFCHRRILAEYIKDKYGIEWEEL
jgi:uncharacterized protein YeaO (DUF488 family)